MLAEGTTVRRLLSQELGKCGYLQLGMNRSLFVCFNLWLTKNKICWRLNTHGLKTARKEGNLLRNTRRSRTSCWYSRSDVLSWRVWCSCGGTGWRMQTPWNWAAVLLLRPLPATRLQSARSTVTPTPLATIMTATFQVEDSGVPQLEQILI
jgi:hypothetical protein